MPSPNDKCEKYLKTSFVKMGTFRGPLPAASKPSRECVVHRFQLAIFVLHGRIFMSIAVWGKFDAL